MRLLLLFLLCAHAEASLQVEKGEVLPYSNSKYPLKDLIRDYADMKKINVTYPSEMISEKETVHIELNSKLTGEEFKKLFYEILDNAGYTPIEDKSILWIHNARDIRYLVSPVYTDNNFPRDASYSTVIYKLKYPLSSEITRNLRPMMSRYGRIIDLSDAKTIIINDRGDNVDRLIKTIKNLDIPKAYENLLAVRPVTEEDGPSPMKERIINLELEKKLLEKKYLELKGAQP